MRSLFMKVLLVVLPWGLWGCLLDSTTPSPVKPGPLAGQFRMVPNDASLGDSVAANLAQGVIVPAFPGAQYSLAMDASDSKSPPKLRLYRLFPKDNRYYFNLDQTVKANSQNGRWTWNFSSDIPTQSNWVTVLERDEERWTGTVSNLSFTAKGTGSSHLALNLWITGRYYPTTEGDSAQALGRALLSGFREYYGAAGVVVDTLIVRKASSHPVVGPLYPDDETVLAGGLDGAFDSLGTHLSGISAEALDLVLVGGFTTVGMLGESPLLGLNLEAGSTSVVMISTQRKDSDCGCYVSVNQMDVVMTALHEAGHFFGLRHTTSTTADWLASGDYSVLQDGLKDTPWCPLLNLQVEGLLASAGSGFWSRVWVGNVAGSLSCSDQQNLMFPYAVGGVISPLTADQGELLLSNLSLFPHD